MSEGPSRRAFQFSLRTVLFLGVPLAAALAWIISLDGPYFDPRRVGSHKLGLVICLVNAAFILVLLRGWLGVSRRFVAVRPVAIALAAVRPVAIAMLAAWLVVIAILAGLVLRNRQQSIELQRQQSVPAAPASSVSPLSR